jgi:hypothetical protein
MISIRDQCRRAKVLFFFKQWGGVRKGERGGDWMEEFRMQCLGTLNELRSPMGQTLFQLAAQLVKRR